MKRILWIAVWLPCTLFYHPAIGICLDQATVPDRPTYIQESPVDSLCKSARKCLNAHDYIQMERYSREALKLSKGNQVQTEIAANLLVLSLKFQNKKDEAQQLEYKYFVKPREKQEAIRQAKIKKDALHNRELETQRRLAKDNQKYESSYAPEQAFLEQQERVPPSLRMPRAAIKQSFALHTPMTPSLPPTPVH